MTRTEAAINGLIAETFGPDANVDAIKAIREAIQEIIKLSKLEDELDRIRSMIQVQRALSDGYNE